eukprot:gnl/Chilomastix_cuspidata/3443.p1 GENE.gnl/Chilomastix_cuspidata/3443~~gnl/Chilomastix_cuspidata/3443.p1  ORF type:complete len:851 (+),score=229.51 gnl/Chilomastix_cuspidata/3443:94-2553(+)
MESREASLSLPISHEDMSVTLQAVIEKGSKKKLSRLVKALTSISASESGSMTVATWPEVTNLISLSHEFREKIFKLILNICAWETSRTAFINNGGVRGITFLLSTRDPAQYPQAVKLMRLLVASNVSLSLFVEQGEFLSLLCELFQDGRLCPAAARILWSAMRNEHMAFKAADTPLVALTLAALVAQLTAPSLDAEHMSVLLTILVFMSSTPAGARQLESHDFICDLAPRVCARGQGRHVAMVFRIINQLCFRAPARIPVVADEFPSLVLGITHGTGAAAEEVELASAVVFSLSLRAENRELFLRSQTFVELLRRAQALGATAVSLQLQDEVAKAILAGNAAAAAMFSRNPAGLDKRFRALLQLELWHGAPPPPVAQPWQLQLAAAAAEARERLSPTALQKIRSILGKAVNDPRPRDVVSTMIVLHAAHSLADEPPVPATTALTTILDAWKSVPDPGPRCHVRYHTFALEGFLSLSVAPDVFFDEAEQNYFFQRVCAFPQQTLAPVARFVAAWPWRALAESDVSHAQMLLFNLQAALSNCGDSGACTALMRAITCLAALLPSACIPPGLETFAADVARRFCHAEMVEAVSDILLRLRRRGEPWEAAALSVLRLLHADEGTSVSAQALRLAWELAGTFGGLEKIQATGIHQHLPRFICEGTAAAILPVLAFFPETLHAAAPAVAAYLREQRECSDATTAAFAFIRAFTASAEHRALVWELGLAEAALTCANNLSRFSGQDVSVIVSTIACFAQSSIDLVHLFENNGFAFLAKVWNSEPACRAIGEDQVAIVKRVLRVALCEFPSVAALLPPLRDRAELGV